MASANFPRATVLQAAEDTLIYILSLRSAERDQAQARLREPRKVGVFGLYTIMSEAKARQMAKEEVPSHRYKYWLERVGKIYRLAEVANSLNILLSSQDVEDLRLGK